MLSGRKPGQSILIVPESGQAFVTCQTFNNTPTTLAYDFQRLTIGLGVALRKALFATDYGMVQPRIKMKIRSDSNRSFHKELKI